MFTRLSGPHAIDTESATADGVYYVAQIEDDPDPDTSYLYQDNPDFAEERAAYERGEVAYYGVVVNAYDEDDKVIGTNSLWGIGSNSDASYWREVANQLAQEI